MCLRKLIVSVILLVPIITSATHIFANPRDPAKADAVKMTEALISAILSAFDRVEFPAIGDYEWIPIRDDGDYVVAGYVDTENLLGKAIRVNFTCWLEYAGGDPGEVESWQLGRLDLPDTTSELWYAGLLAQESKALEKKRRGGSSISVAVPSYDELERQRVTFHNAPKLNLHVQVKVGTSQDQIRMLVTSLTAKHKGSFDIVCVHVYTSDIDFAYHDETKRLYQSCCISEWITTAKGEPNYPVTTEDFYEDERLNGIALDWRGEFGNTPLDKVRKALYEGYQKGYFRGDGE